ncbi:hypothetical protein AUJ42_03590 [Candidatus Collierbacteria bacterium CG1_02_44_10]|uniref:DUF262 domain-containing protein n=1 Tax=Candidatus Collierbacteria bacterium CG1_02_44_10 TaxID=1805087 RepID=A0A1J4RTF5_9BACT|nr:MAG: hypothetical protein AUJ42_03590 [Candidatus Collierbacteria bacterium CG1_02_44_10]
MSDRLFKQVNYDLGTLVSFIELGTIGLPDIQRPFVWKDSKVRDLFDSMYRGYPVGYLLLWQNAFDQESRQIGADSKQKSPNLLIVDGQQRLTSLFAVIRGIPVVRENYEKETIEISFNPLTEKFEVADAATKRDPSFIPNISILWDKTKSGIFDIVKNYIDNNTHEGGLSPEDIKKVQESVSKLNDILTFPLTALELSSAISEEQVAEVFVRINSEGSPLNQSDFILTLMSVFWDEGRTALEDFCRHARKPGDGSASPYNLVSQPDPDQLLRVSVGLGFKRARLHYVYSILRGKDLETGEFSEQRRIDQFELLKGAQERVLNLLYWHDFLKAIALSGYRSREYISSQTNLMFAYTLYLIGRTEYKVEEFKLRQVIAKWFFMSSLTGRFTGSPESAMEFDLARFRSITSADDYVSELERVCSEVFTDDYWAINLPSNLATTSARSPSLFAYYASLVLLDAQVLFSKQKVSSLLDSSIKSTRSALERHHLFPKAYLKSIGIGEQRDTNQIANYAVVEWNDNSAISDTSPKEYLPLLIKRFTPQELKRLYYWHALPDNWEEMEYKEFLMRRRERIAQIIGDAYHKLNTEGQTLQEVENMPVVDLINQGETGAVEFKSTLRTNLHTGEPDPRIELSVLKTIAGFLNGKGGTLLIGVSDDKEPLGLDNDHFTSDDKLHLHLVNLLNNRIGSHWTVYVHPRFEDLADKRILAIDCTPSRVPIYVKDGSLEHFYIRAGNSTSELQGTQAQEYIRLRFRT